jgi:hypothetical protein
MDLYKRGYIDILNRNPLQLKILKNDAIKKKNTDYFMAWGLFKNSYKPNNKVEVLSDGDFGSILLNKPLPDEVADPESGKDFELLSRGHARFFIEDIQEGENNKVVNGTVMEGEFKTNEKHITLFDLSEHSDLKPYEQIFLESIADDGTLSKNRIPIILKSISRSLQGKVWKGDVNETAKNYTKKNS